MGRVLNFPSWSTWPGEKTKLGLMEIKNPFFRMGFFRLEKEAWV
jgi:hypothetical protein